MTENTQEKVTTEVPDLTKGDKINTYIRSTFLLGSFNFERMQSIGFAVSMIPAIKRFYTKKEDQAEALTRHLEFFNTQPWVASPIIGVTAAMEREKAAGKEGIDDAAITNVKVGLMGPLAGVGDPIYWGTARIVLAAVGASFAIARIVEQNMVSIDPGVVEAARAMGASRLRILFTVMIPEALGPLILGYTFIVIGVVDMSAMAGYVGGGGLGKVAIVDGYQRFQDQITWAVVAVIIVLVQLVQLIGNMLAKKALRR